VEDELSRRQTRFSPPQQNSAWCLEFQHWTVPGKVPV